MRKHNDQVNPCWSGCHKKTLEYRCSWWYQHQYPCHCCSIEQNLCCTKSRLQFLSGSSVVWGELLGAFISSVSFLNNHLIMLNFWRNTAQRKAKVVTVFLCNGVRFIWGKLVVRNAHSNWQIHQGLKSSHEILCRFCWSLQMVRGSKGVLNLEHLKSLGFYEKII